MTAAFRRVLMPAAWTLAMLVVLVGLGTWQVYRLHWKEAILARVAAAEAAPAEQLTSGAGPYAKVFVTGHFRFDRAVQFGAEVRDTRSGPTMGSFQVVPLERAQGAPILVDRGWIPQEQQTALDDPAGVVTVTGYVRPAEGQHWFSPADDPVGRRFFTLDPAAIGAAIGVPDPAPFTLVAMGPPATGSYPEPAQTLPRPPNNHLSYAITWYALAVCLVVIFFTWVRKAYRS